MDIISAYFEQYQTERPSCVVDIHGHMGRWFNFNIPGRTDEDIICAMNRYGIDRIVLSHLKSITGNFVEGNREAMALAERFPGRVFAYIGVDPHYVEDTAAELERWSSCTYAPGIKMHPETHCYSILDDCCVPVFQFADAKKLPVLIHIWGPEAAKDCVTVARKYPGMTLIMGHSGGPQAYREAVWAARQAGNIALDITGSYAYEGVLEWTVRQIGARRIFFGSDMPFIDAKHTLGRVLHSDLTLEEKKLILSDNALRLLGWERR